MSAHGDDGAPPAPWLEALHPVFVGVLTAASAQAALWGLAVALFSTTAVVVALLVAVPLGYLLLLIAVTRATTGRAHVGWNMVLTTVLCVFAVAVGTAAGDLPWLGGVPALPLTLGVAAAVTSTLVLPGAVKIVGAVAVAAQLAVVSVPFAVRGAELAARQAAEDAAELDRRNERNTRPYVVSGLTVQIVLPTDYETDVMLSRDPAAPARDGYGPEQGDLVLSTAPLVAGQSVESEVCRSILVPDAGGSAANECRRLDDRTWVLEAGGEVSVVRIVDGSRLELGAAPGARGANGGTDGRTDGGTDELLSLLDDAELMTVEEFADWNAWLFERDQRV